MHDRQLCLYVPIVKMVKIRSQCFEIVSSAHASMYEYVVSVEADDL